MVQIHTHGRPRSGPPTGIHDLNLEHGLVIQLIVDNIAVYA